MSFTTTHNIGNQFCFTSGKYKIISNIEVSDLRVRHVRKTNSTSCAKKSQEHDHIEMSGPINPDTPYIIERLLNKIKSSTHAGQNPTVMIRHKSIFEFWRWLYGGRL